MYICISRALLVGLILAGVSLTGCGRGGGAGGSELEKLRTELSNTQQQLAQTEKTVNAQKQELDRMTLEADTAKKQLSDQNVASIQKDNQLRALQTQINDHRDALTYADISATLQRGFASVALDRYRQFVADHPNSPLVSDANRAISELAVTVERESRERAKLIDPKRQDRQALKNFQDGIATVDEISPLLRQKTVAEVIKLLGPPHRSYRNGTEIGYVDKIIDATTGNKETLVLTVEGDRVVSLRVGYRGREIKL